MDDGLDKRWHLSAFAIAERKRANEYRLERSARREAEREAKAAQRIRVDVPEKEKTLHPGVAMGISHQISSWLHKVNRAPVSAARTRARARG